jgi:peptidylprolyl isomerase
MARSCTATQSGTGRGETFDRYPAAAMRRPALLLIALAALAGCGSSTKPADIPSADTSSAPAATATETTATATTTTQSQGTARAPLVSPTKDLSKKPKIPKQPGDAPTQLVKQDVVKGKGAVAKEGDVLTVRYVGVRFRDNQEFDSSWKRKPNEFKFPLGQGQVIQGWDQGVAGMRVGGRRQLTIPADLAYGAQGSPPDIGPNEPLIFVVDLKKVDKS